MPKVEDEESIRLCSCSGPLGALSNSSFMDHLAMLILCPLGVYAFFAILIYTKESKQHLHRTCASSISWSQQTGVVFIVIVNLNKFCETEFMSS
jgi:hypothetical protein